MIANSRATERLHKVTVLLSSSACPRVEALLEAAHSNCVPSRAPEVMHTRLVTCTYWDWNADSSRSAFILTTSSVAVSPQDFPPTADGSDIYIIVNGNYVLSARPTQGCPPGEIGLTDTQRTWAGITLGPQDMVAVQPYDAFSQQGGQSYLGGIEVEVGFAVPRRTTDAPYDQDELATQFKKNFENQILAPGQQLLLDVKNIPLRMSIRTVQLVDLSMEKTETSAPLLTDPRARGILTRHTQVDFFKDARTDIKLKASNRTGSQLDHPARVQV
jgi:hypothetical protein